ncbi:MAG: hypothetical protein WD060_14300 [Pirellulales bacterium]
MSLSDENLPGATSQSLSLTVRGSVVSPTDVIFDVTSGTQTQTSLNSSLVNIAAGTTLDVRSISGGYTVSSGQTLGGYGSLLGTVTFGAGYAGATAWGLGFSVLGLCDGCVRPET